MAVGRLAGALGRSGGGRLGGGRGGGGRQLGHDPGEGAVLRLQPLVLRFQLLHLLLFFFCGKINRVQLLFMRAVMNEKKSDFEFGNYGDACSLVSYRVLVGC